MSNMVAVPRDLLKAVLDTAESNSESVEGEFACTDTDREEFAKERELIQQLREIAGIDTQPESTLEK